MFAPTAPSFRCGGAPLRLQPLCQGQAAPVLHPEVPGGAVGGASVQVAARGGNRGVAELLLHQVDRRAPAKAVARVSMAPLMRRDRLG